MYLVGIFVDVLPILQTSYGLPVYVNNVLSTYIPTQYLLCCLRAQELIPGFNFQHTQVRISVQCTQCRYVKKNLDSRDFIFFYPCIIISSGIPLQGPEIPGWKQENLRTTQYIPTYLICTHTQVGIYIIINYLCNMSIFHQKLIFNIDVFSHVGR